LRKRKDKGSAVMLESAPIRVSDSKVIFP